MIKVANFVQTVFAIIFGNLYALPDFKFFQIAKTSLLTVAKNGNYGYYYIFVIVFGNFFPKFVSHCFYSLNSNVTKHCNKFTELQIAKIGKCCQLPKLTDVGSC